MNLARPTLLALANTLLLTATQAVEIAEKADLISIENSSLRLPYNLKSGTYSGTDLRSGITTFSNARFTVDETGWKQPKGAIRKRNAAKLDDEFGKGKRLTLSNDKNAELKWSVS